MLTALADDLSFDLVGHLAVFGQARTRDLAAALGVGTSDITKRIKPLDESGVVSRGAPNHKLVDPVQVQRVLRESDRLAIGVMDMKRAQAHRKFAAREHMLSGVSSDPDLRGRVSVTRLHWQHTDEPGRVVLGPDEGVLVSEDYDRVIVGNVDYMPFRALVAGLSASGQLSADWALAAAKRTVAYMTPDVWPSSVLPASRHYRWRDVSETIFAGTCVAEEAHHSFLWALVRADTGEPRDPARTQAAIAADDDPACAAPPSPGGPPQTGRRGRGERRDS